jgi:acetyl esterase/lipase
MSAIFGDIEFKTKAWSQFGVRNIIKELPSGGIGVLAPEVLAELKGRDASVSARQLKAMESGDYSELRKTPPPNRDITTEPIRQQEFKVRRGGYEIPVTSYCLEAKMKKIKPGVVYFHGGAWRMGSRLNVQNPLRLLTQLSGAIVFNVEYRLAPEHTYPVGTDDCWAVVKYVHVNAQELGIDPAKIAVAGDSAGGNFAAVCSRRDRNGRFNIIRQQILIYPALTHTNPDGMTDYHFSLDDYEFDDSEAHYIVPCITALSTSVPGRFLYVNNSKEARLPDTSPLLDTDFLRLPKTLIVCAEYDFLTQQCRTYARRLAKAGVDVTLIMYRGTNHGFMIRVGRYPQSTDVQKEIAKAISLL